MTKPQLYKLVRWMESEDYQDFAFNFTTRKRRVDYIYKNYVKQSQ